MMKKYNLAPGDFPDIADFQSKLQEMDFTKFNRLKQKMVDDVEQVLGNDFPRLMEALPRVDYGPSSGGNSALPPGRGGGGAFPPPVPSSKAGDDSNPWWDGDDEVATGSSWALQEYVSSYEGQFNTCQSGGFVLGKTARDLLSAAGIPKASLKKIWDLGDIDKDGNLDLYEFVLVMYLIDLVKQGGSVPDSLEANMIPPGK